MTTISVNEQYNTITASESNDRVIVVTGTDLQEASVIVNQETGTVVVADGENEVSVTASSEETVVIEIMQVGPQGPQGTPGAALSTYTHNQATPSSLWTINHNLGFKPSVELLNSGSQEIEGDVLHTSLNQVVVSFTGPVAGLARLV